MTFSIDVLEAELKRDEGVRARPYKDTRGFNTVGIGHNLDVSPLPYTYPLTSAQIDAVFKDDIASTIAKLDKALPWWRQLDDARQRVLLNMTFNMGIGVPGGVHGLLSFRNFLANVRARNFNTASDLMLKSLWASQVGQRANRLSDLMRNGDLPSVIAQPAAPVAAPKPARALNPLEQFAMNISLFSLILRLLPLLPMLEANIALEVKDLASTADGKTKVLHLIDVLQDMLQKIENALKGTNDPTA